MSSIATISAFDGAATPVLHNMLAESVAREKGTISASYKESLAGVPDYAQATIVLKRSKLGSGVNRTNARFQFPVMESVSGVNAAGYTAAPKVAYIDTLEVNGLFHERSLITGRRSVRQFGLNVCGGIATSVAPVVTGPVPEMIDQLIMPT